MAISPAVKMCRSIDMAASVVENKDISLFVYCHSGARSSQAVSVLRRMGHTRVKNIGGIAAYSRKVEQ